MKETLKVDPRVEKVLKMISENDFDKNQLRNLYENVTADKKISDIDRELIIAKLETKMRVSSVALANKIFGPKDSVAREAIKKILSSVEKSFNFTDNQVGNGVKTGGDMISGKAHVDVYGSFKNKQKWHTSVAAYQEKPEDEMLLRVTKFHQNYQNPVGFKQELFSFSELEKAAEKYKEFLLEMS